MYSPQFSGTHTPLSCQPGSYQPDLGQGNCTSCLPGSECPYANMTFVVPCRKGYYCPLGTPIPCPAGTFGNRTGLKELSMCTDCPPGRFCDQTGQTKSQGPCTAGWYCQGGAITSTPNVTNSLKYPENGPCPKGRYCLEGTPSPAKCPPGTYRNSTGAASESECLDCNPGWYCEGYGNEEPTAQCAAGYYCPQGSRSNVSQPSETPCTVGHFCPEGTADPKPCGAGENSQRQLP